MTKSNKSRLVLSASLTLAILAVIFVLFAAKPAYAGTVKPSGKTGGYTDKTNIQNELNTNKSVKLVSGKTYYTDGPLYISSGMSINATGATIICRGGMFLNIPYQVKYGSLDGFSVVGGTWLSSSASGYYGSSVKLTHAKNISLQSMTIRHANASKHTLELVACKNVLINGCNISQLGSSSSQTEEAVQLDVASHATAYFLESRPYNSKIASAMQNGGTCKNVGIVNCVIVGNRGVVANYTRKDGGKYIGKLHANIVLQNNVITGLKGEGVSLFNTRSATVTGNTIVSLAGGSGSAYTIGLHFACFGTNSRLSKGPIIVYNNTIKGGRQALQVYSHSSSKYGNVSIYGNNLFCKRGSSAAVKVSSSQCNGLTIAKNKTNGWNGK